MVAIEAAASDALDTPPTIAAVAVVVVAVGAVVVHRHHSKDEEAAVDAASVTVVAVAATVASANLSHHLRHRRTSRVFDTILPATVLVAPRLTSNLQTINQPSPVPSRLRQMATRWMEADKWAGNIVTHGLRPCFHSFPPNIHRGDSLVRCRSPEQMQAEIEKLISSGAVRIAASSDQKGEEKEEENHQGVISRMFPVPRKDGRIRQ